MHVHPLLQPENKIIGGEVYVLRDDAREVRDVATSAVAGEEGRWTRRRQRAIKVTCGDEAMAVGDAMGGERSMERRRPPGDAMEGGARS